MTTLILFIIFAFIAALCTIGISFFIVDQIEIHEGRILSALWGTGYMGHAIFLAVFLIEIGIAEIFKNWF